MTTTDKSLYSQCYRCIQMIYVSLASPLLLFIWRSFIVKLWYCWFWLEVLDYSGCAQHGSVWKTEAVDVTIWYIQWLYYDMITVYRSRLSGCGKIFWRIFWALSITDCPSLDEWASWNSFNLFTIYILVKYKCVPQSSRWEGILKNILSLHLRLLLSQRLAKLDFNYKLQFSWYYISVINTKARHNFECKTQKPDIVNGSPGSSSSCLNGSKWHSLLELHGDWWLN